MKPTDWVPLSTIAHGRSGDKGRHANIAVFAYTPAGYTWLLERLRAQVIEDYFGPLKPSRVERFEAPNLLALNFVLFDVLAGGASQSLRIDTQGKTLALALLQMPIERPPGYTAMLRGFQRGNLMADLVLYEARPTAVVITLNRPDKRNALSRADRGAPGGVPARPG